MNPVDISEVLSELGYTPRCIVNVCKKENGQLPLRPLFRVELEPASNNPSIYEVHHLLHVRITLESFKPCNEAPYCRNCQHVGQSKQYCLRSARCIKCGNGYKSVNCTLAPKDLCK